jgi:hypothetical protein
MAAVVAALPALGGDPVKPAPAVKIPPPKSVFVMPASPRDGRDPFFPESLRPYEDAPATKREVDSTVFVIKGISNERGHLMAIINNHTFAAGDQGDVLTTSGRVHLRVISIAPDSVVIEANGTRRLIKDYNN